MPNKLSATKAIYIPSLPGVIVENSGELKKHNELKRSLVFAMLLCSDLELAVHRRTARDSFKQKLMALSLFFKHQYKPVCPALDVFIEDDLTAIISRVSKCVCTRHKTETTGLNLLPRKRLDDAM